MNSCTTCKEAIEHCMSTHTFAFAHLYGDEKIMDMHIHNCCEVYYSISGGKQFLIDHCLYDIRPGDLFLINQFESHHLTQIDQQTHERIILSIDLIEALHRRDRSWSLFFFPRHQNATPDSPLPQGAEPLYVFYPRTA